MSVCGKCHEEYILERDPRMRGFRLTSNSRPIAYIEKRIFFKKKIIPLYDIWIADRAFMFTRLHIRELVR